MPLAMEAHQASAYAVFEMNQAAVQRVFVTSIQFPDGFARVVEKDGVVVGGMGGIISESHLGVKCAVDLFTFSHGGTDKLIREFREWARERGARFIQITDNSGRNRYQNLIAGMGFQPSGMNFIGVA